MSRLRVCFLSSIHPALDKRVHYKEAVTLAKAGFDVVHVAQGDGDTTTRDGVTIVSFPGGWGFRKRLTQLRTLYRSAAGVDADCYHCNESESWFIGVLLKLRRRKLVVFDVHELYSAELAERFPRGLRWFVAACTRLGFRMLVPFTDQLIFAKPSVAPDFPDTDPAPVVVQNFTEISARDGDDSLHPPRPPRDAGEPLTAVHIGAINRDRGWPQLLDGLARTTEPSIRVRVIGKFGDGSDDAFAARAEELGIAERVSFDGWIPYDEVQEELRNCDVGLITFQPTKLNFIYAMPHKLFDYMLAGLPVIVPEYAVDVAAIVRDGDCGLLVDATDPDAIGAALDQLAGDDERRRTLGSNGRRAVLERYNWQTEAGKLVAAYDRLEASHMARRAPA